ncbi:MAG: hypothetical protein AVDCRST_MAG73-994, partial [uncultured Thermomicrobiales bacterium]
DGDDRSGATAPASLVRGAFRRRTGPGQSGAPRVALRRRGDGADRDPPRCRHLRRPHRHPQGPRRPPGRPRGDAGLARRGRIDRRTGGARPRRALGRRGGAGSGRSALVQPGQLPRPAPGSAADGGQPARDPGPPSALRQRPHRGAVHARRHRPRRLAGAGPGRHLRPAGARRRRADPAAPDPSRTGRVGRGDAEPGQPVAGRVQAPGDPDRGRGAPDQAAGPRGPGRLLPV